MKQTLIKIADDHYVVVNDSEIKEGDMSLLIVDGFAPMRLVHFEPVQEGYIGKKITHSTQPFEDVGLNTSMGNQLGFDKIEPMYLSEVKELIGEVDVEKKAKDEYVDHLHNPFFKAAPMGYIKGYNQALEDNKERKYTEEDIIEVVRLSLEDAETSVLWSKEWYPRKLADKILQSLQPKTQWEVTFDEQGKLRLL